MASTLRLGPAHCPKPVAGVSCEGHQKNKRERLCRYIARNAVAVPRLSLSSTGKVVYTLKTPYRDGTTQVAFDRGGHPPVDFVARLAALVPKPRVNLTRYHGVLAPARATQITAGVDWSHRPGAGKAPSPPPTQKPAHPPSVMPL